MKTLIVIDMQNDFVTGVLGSRRQLLLCRILKRKLMHTLLPGMR